jgi:pilus assembly protein CpaE
MTAAPTFAPDLGSIAGMPLARPDLEVPELPPVEPLLPSWQIEAPSSTEMGPKVLLVEELERVASHISGLIAPDEHVKLVATEADGQAALERMMAEGPDVVILDALMQGSLGGMRLARRMREAGLDTPVLFVTVPNQPVTLDAEVGLAEVMTLPLDGYTLLATINRLHQARRGPKVVPSNGTVAVFSAAGGTGRTTIAHNLAVALKQVTGARVALFDGDQAHGDLRLHLEAPGSTPSLVQMPTGHATDADLAPLLWQDPAGIDVLLAPPRMEEADLILLADIRRAISMLRRLHDVVVVDVPTVMDDRTLAILDDADVVLDVVGTDRAAVNKAQRCHDVLAAADFPLCKVVSVSNQVRPGAGLDVGALIDRPLEAILPHDHRLVSGELPAGGAVVAMFPDAPLSQGMLGLASALAARLGGDIGALSARAA